MYYKYKNSYKTTQKFYAVRFDMASLWELGLVIFGPTEDFISWLQGKQIPGHVHALEL